MKIEIDIDVGQCIHFFHETYDFGVKQYIKNILQKLIDYNYIA